MSDISKRAYYSDNKKLPWIPAAVTDFRYSFLVPEGRMRKRDREVTIAVVRDSLQQGAATRLLSDRYRWRGFEGQHSVSRKPNMVTFEACCEGKTVGTLTLAIDSAAGLALDATFHEELEKFRAGEDAQLCELTKFAVDFDGSTWHVLAALFHVIFMYGTIYYHCSDLLIEVIPSHRRFYETMLGFRRVGELRMNQRVEAQTQLMAIRVADIRRLIEEGVRDAEALGPHSLYRYFFKPQEEFEILFQLMGRQQSPLSEH